MEVRDLESLRRDLVAFRSEWEDPDQRARLVDSALPRIRALLDLLPEPAAGAAPALLELGSAPFFNSLCLDRVWRGPVRRANYFGTSERTGVQVLRDPASGREKRLEFELFNVETDEFPYDDASFDVVVFSELIEHLAVNPVWALAEMHRVLKPGGHLILTTPNLLSLDRLLAYVADESQMVDRYAPSFGYGARHNREYSAREVRLLLEATGFVVERLEVRDIDPPRFWHRLRRSLLRAGLRAVSSAPRQSHILVRARRGESFRWEFPEDLFAHLDIFRLVRAPVLEMGGNDRIQLGPGWSPRSTDADGGAFRRIDGTVLREHWRDEAIAYLRGTASARRLVLTVRAAGETVLEVDVRPLGEPDRSPGGSLGRGQRTLEAGGWREVLLELDRSPDQGQELEVGIGLPAGRTVDVRRIALGD